MFSPRSDSALPPSPRSPLAFSQSLPLTALLMLLAVTAGLASSAGAQAVTSFTLVNADTDSDIGPLEDGDTVDLAALPTQNLNVRANTSGPVGSVVFGYDGDGTFQTESVAPYALNGDINGDYNAWTPAVGDRALEATPYAQSGGSGSAGSALAITFTVVDGGGDGGDGGDGGGDEGSGDVTLAGVTNSGGSTGQLYQYRPVTLTLDGPQASEGGSPNPFLDYRFDVTFTAPGGEQLTVPGYFAADGNAANSGATSGTTWRAHLTPSETGTWTYAVSFRQGNDVAVSANASAGSAVGPYNGLSGSFSVGAAPGSSPGNYARGLLRYVGERYLSFDSGERFLKGGADSPENLLAYEDFDNTSNYGGPNYVKSWEAHVQDWTSGDPTWKGGKGKGLIGALNYLASEGMNAFSFLPFNAPQGDGKDVWPWLSPTNRLRYDVSKLAQWDVVFSHADRLGLFLHFKTQETENDQTLDGGALGTERKLYYRELVARFGYHLALNWNLGEENTNTNAQRKAFADYFDDLDPYGHPIVIHSYPNQYEQVYGPLVGGSDLTGASIQLGNMSGGHELTLEWLRRSEAAGRPWHVAIDEPGNAGTGVTCDGGGNNYAAAREEALWANLMAGGTGVEWYFGYQTCAGDLDAEDWRTRDRLWDYTRYALQFFRTHLPFQEMASADNLTSSSSDYVFAKEGEVYAVYLPDGGSASLGLAGGAYDVQWFDPRNGGALQTGTVTSVDGGGTRSIGAPPSATSQDWVALVTRSGDGGDGGDGGAVAFAVNAGGGAYTSDAGLAYEADEAFSGGRTYTTGDAIAGTQDDVLYRSERYGNFAYAIPLASGTYEVTFRFAEIYWQAAGQRAFDVKAEGATVISDLDLYAEAGHDAAYDLTRTVDVADGTLNLQFVTLENNAKVAAVLVRQAGAAAKASTDEAAADVALDGLAERAQAYPNPFSASTAITYALAAPAPVRLELYDGLGRRVALLADEHQGAGRHRVSLDGTGLVAGVYYWRLRAGSRVETGQIVLIR